MENIDWIWDVTKFVFSGLGAVAILWATKLSEKFQLWESKYTNMSQRQDLLEKELILYKWEATKTFVDKVEYMRTMDKVEDKLDKINQNVNELRDHLLTNH